MIQHDRHNNVPNLYPSTTVGGSDHDAHVSDPARHYSDDKSNKFTTVPDLEIPSHGTGTKWISIQTTGSDDRTKCVSAQWGGGYHTEEGTDHAGTLYECVVDLLNLGATLEKTK